MPADHYTNHLVKDAIYRDIELDLTQAVSTDIDLAIPKSSTTRLWAIRLIVDKYRNTENFQTDPQLTLYVGDGTSNVALSAATALTDVEGQYQFIVPVTSAPVCSGADQKIFGRITTAAVGVVTATRARTSGVSTIVTGTAHNLVVGDSVRVNAMTDTTFNGQHYVTAVNSATSFSFAQAGEADVASGADVGGDVGVFLCRGEMQAVYR